jgi:hypothetical protein
MRRPMKLKKGKRMRTKQPPTEDLVAVYVVSSDGSKDRMLDRVLAHQLYKEGKLAIDLTNTNTTKIVYCPVDEYWAEVKLLTKPR